jgi:excisionase family DNA binding protein
VLFGTSSLIDDKTSGTCLQDAGMPSAMPAVVLRTFQERLWGMARTTKGPPAVFVSPPSGCPGARLISGAATTGGLATPSFPMTTPIALSIPEVCKISGLGKTKIYDAIKRGHLVARKYGRRTVVLYEDLVEFLRNLPRTRR